MIIKNSILYSQDINSNRCKNCKHVCENVRFFLVKTGCLIFRKIQWEKIVSISFHLFNDPFNSQVLFSKQWCKYHPRFWASRVIKSVWRVLFEFLQINITKDYAMINTKLLKINHQDDVLYFITFIYNAFLYKSLNFPASR